MSRLNYVTAFDRVGYQRRRGSFMGAHDLLNLLNKLRKNDNMRVLLNIFSLFRNELNTINNTGAQILHSIYHMPLKLLKITFRVKKSRLYHLLRNGIIDVIK